MLQDNASWVVGLSLDERNIAEHFTIVSSSARVNLFLLRSFGEFGHGFDGGVGDDVDFSFFVFQSDCPEGYFSYFSLDAGGLDFVADIELVF